MLNPLKNSLPIWNGNNNATSSNQNVSATTWTYHVHVVGQVETQAPKDQYSSFHQQSAHILVHTKLEGCKKKGRRYSDAPYLVAA